MYIVLNTDESISEVLSICAFDEWATERTEDKMGMVLKAWQMINGADAQVRAPPTLYRHALGQ